MSDMLSFVPFARYGINSTTTSRTGTPTAYKWVPFYQNGFGLGETITSEDLATVHQYQGTRYSIFTGRNDQKGTINMPIMPENASTFFGAATTLTAGSRPTGRGNSIGPRRSPPTGAARSTTGSNSSERSATASA